MESLSNEIWYNGDKEYRISVIRENNGEIVATASEIQAMDREVAVLRERQPKDFEVGEAIARLKKSLLVYPFRPI